MNTIENAVPVILAQGLFALREFCVMPSLVDSSYSKEAAEKGDTVDVLIPDPVPARPVAPAVTAPNIAGVVPTKVQINLDQWYEAPFYLTDKGMMEVQAGVLPGEASEAIRSVANVVNANLYSNYKAMVGFVGTEGQELFVNDTNIMTAAGAQLNKQSELKGNRSFVMDGDNYANALNHRTFQDIEFGAIPDASFLAPKFGFTYHEDQLLPEHVAGTASGYLVNDPAGPDVLVLGDTSIPIDTGTGTFKAGDLFQFAGLTQWYSVQEDYAGGAGTISIRPGLKAVPIDGAALTPKGTSYTVNLAFQRGCIAFATRPLEDTAFEGTGGFVESVVDPVSQLTLRLEVRREHKRTRWSFDILWGSKVIRPELGIRVFS